MKPGTSEVPSCSQLYTGHSSGQGHADYVPSCPGDGVSGCEQPLGRVGVRALPISPGPVARVITSQPLLSVVLCPFYHFKAARWEEEGLPGVGVLAFSRPLLLCTHYPGPSGGTQLLVQGEAAAPWHLKLRCVPHKCHEASFFSHHELTNV